MHISARTVIIGLLGLARFASSLPAPATSTSCTPETISNSTDADVVLDEAGGPGPAHGITGSSSSSSSWLAGERRARFRSRAPLAGRGGGGGGGDQDSGLPDRNRKLADHMEHYGYLPDCYKQCMRLHDGKSSIHMGQDTLGLICGVKWPLFAWWSEEQLYDCTNHGIYACPAKKDHRDAYSWLKWTCGDKPS